MAADHNYFANLIWQIADLLRGPYRPPQYERVMLPMTVLRRFDSVLAPTKAKVVAEHERVKGGKLEGDALDTKLNKVAGQRFHNHSALDFEKLKGDPNNLEKHLVSYIKGFSANVRRIFDHFEFEGEIEKMRESNILFLVVSKFAEVDLHPSKVPNEQMGLIFENLIRRFNELANETAGDHFTPREVIRLMVNLLFMHDDKLLATPGTVRKLLDPACGTGGMLAEAQRYMREHQAEARLYVYGQDYNKRAFATAAGFAYSIGAFQSFGLPEIILFGLPMKSMQSIINGCVDEFKAAGGAPKLGVPVNGILEGFPVVFREVGKDYYRGYLGYALWFYKGRDFRVIQLIWPDKQGRFPWEPGFSKDLIQLQPLLG